MKTDIHPKYTEITVTCTCGNTFQTRSTLGTSLRLRRPRCRPRPAPRSVITKCSTGHPFYTGKQKMLDSGGRVDRFRKKYGLK